MEDRQSRPLASSAALVDQLCEEFRVLLIEEYGEDEREAAIIVEECVLQAEAVAA